MNTPVDDATLDVALRLADLALPSECRAGLLANLALLAHHGAILRRLDDPHTDPAELITP